MRFGCFVPDCASSVSPGEGGRATLIRLRNLPPDTQIYCGHERTVLNLQFALSIEPHNTALLHRAKTVIRLAEKKQPTIPVTVAQERQTNPFLRADLPSVASQVGMHGAPAARVFKELVERRKLFRSLASVA